MKKFMNLLLAVALVMSLSVPAFAAPYDETDTEATVNLSFTLTAAATPSYTVTIPGSLNLKEGDNFLPITVSDADLDGGSINITLEETSREYDAGKFNTTLYVGGIYSMNNYIRYWIYDSVGSPYIISFVSGTLLEEFTDNGTKNPNFFVVTGESYLSSPGSTYTGHITFGIEYVPAP